MKIYIKEGIIKAGHSIVCQREIDGEMFNTFNPTEDMILADGWVEYTPPQPEPPSQDEQYKIRIVELIREKYTMDDELAILRQRETKAEEFAAYNDYVEECKNSAKKEIYGV